MMLSVNGITWTLAFVPWNHYELWTGDRFTLGVTDPSQRIIFLSADMPKDKLYDVIAHELCHCWLASYGLSMIEDKEECVCSMMEVFGDDVHEMAEDMYNRLTL